MLSRKEEQEIRKKLKVLAYAEELGNVSKNLPILGDFKRYLLSLETRL